MSPQPPPTVIVVHPRERRSKCSVEPLRGRDDIRFFRFPDPVTCDRSRYVRLALNAPQITADDADHGLLLLDGTWRLAARMEPFFEDIPARSLPPVRTAYPRQSHLFEDPAEGLATIEALYAALRILGRPLDGLLDHYHWREEFLRRNGWD